MSYRTPDRDIQHKVGNILADISFEGAAFWCKLNFRQAGGGTIWGTKLNCEFLFRLIDKEVLIGRSRAEASGPADKMDHISVSVSPED